VAGFARVCRPQPAQYRAQRCLDICLENKIGDFDLAYAYEALARFNHARLPGERDQYHALARESGDEIAEKGDKDMFLNDLATVP